MCHRERRSRVEDSRRSVHVSLNSRNGGSLATSAPRIKGVGRGRDLLEASARLRFCGHGVLGQPPRPLRTSCAARKLASTVLHEDATGAREACRRRAQPCNVQQVYQMCQSETSPQYVQRSIQQIATPYMAAQGQHSARAELVKICPAQEQALSLDVARDSNGLFQCTDEILT